MRSEDIRKVQHAQPFQPFVVHVADGRQFTINHPEFILVSKSERTVVIDDVQGNLEILDPLLISSLSVPASQASS
jgi:hypothetical protein